MIIKYKSIKKMNFEIKQIVYLKKFKIWMNKLKLKKLKKKSKLNYKIIILKNNNNKNYNFKNENY